MSTDEQKRATAPPEGAEEDRTRKIDTGEAPPSPRDASTAPAEVSEMATAILPDTPRQRGLAGASGAPKSPVATPPAAIAPDATSPPATTAPGQAGDGAALAAGERMADRYRIEGVLGVGGMGVVYRAFDEVVGLEVALKVLRPEVAKDEEFLQRFRNELVVARRVTHRNVVRIHDIGEDQGRYYMSMDLIEGQSLQDMLKEQGRLDVDSALRLALQMARALDEAHRQTVVHRDLKPANILIDAAGEAYISDFGIARSLAAPAMTRTGIVMGTPHYLSPEQARGEAVDGRSDLYTLGLILVEMLSGKLPFPGGTLLEILTQRMAGEPTSLDELGIEVPAEVSEVVDRCLAKDANERYQTPGELISDLEALLGHGAPAKPRKRRKRGASSSRRPWLWGLAALAAAGVVAAVLVLRPGSKPVPAPSPPPSAAPTETPPATAAPTTALPRHAVAVLPFHPEGTGEDLSWASTGIAEMLASDLAESEGLRVVDSVRVVQRLEDLGFGGARLRDDELRQLAEVFAVDRLVTGQLRAVGDQLRLEAQLLEADLPGAPLRPLEAQEGTAESLFGLVTGLGGALREALEVPALAGVDAERGATGPGSTSAGALKAYSQGLDLLSRGSALDAVPLLEEAVAEDPQFLGAWVRLAEAYRDLGRESDALEAARQAVRYAGPGSGRAGYEARAQEAILRGDPEGAQQLFEELVERYPNDVEALIALAEAYGAQGQFGEAISRLETAVQVDPGEPRAWYLLGRFSIQSGDSQRAVDEYLVRALVQQTRLRNKRGQAEVHNAFGVGYMQLGDLDQALASYDEAAEIQQRLGDDEGLAKAFYNIALVNITRGDAEAGEAAMDRSLGLYTDLDNRPGMARLHNLRGVVEEERGRYPEALAAYRQGLQLREEGGDQWELAESYTNVGYSYYLLGEYDNALLYHDRALSLHRDTENPNGEMLSLQSIGFCQLAKGQWPAASQSFLGSLELSRELGAKNATAVSQGSLGQVAQLQGRYSAALTSYAEALEILREIEDPRGQVEVGLNEAEALLELGNVAAVTAVLDSVEQTLATVENREHRARLLALRGRLALTGEAIDTVPQDFGVAVSEAEASQSAAAILRARWGAAAAELATGRPATARSALEELLDEAQRLGHAEIQVRVAETLAEAALEVGDADAADDALRRGLRVIDRSGSYGRSFRLHQLLSEVAGRRGQTASAARALRDAIAELGRVRDSLSPEHRESFDRLPEVRELRAAEAQLGA